MGDGHRAAAAGGGLDLPRRPWWQPRAAGLLAPRCRPGRAVAVARQRLLRVLPPWPGRGARADRAAARRPRPCPRGPRVRGARARRAGGSRGLTRASPRTSTVLARHLDTVLTW